MKFIKIVLLYSLLLLVNNGVANQIDLDSLFHQYQHVDGLNRVAHYDSIINYYSEQFETQDSGFTYRLLKGCLLIDNYAYDEAYAVLSELEKDVEGINYNKKNTLYFNLYKSSKYLGYSNHLKTYLDKAYHNAILIEDSSCIFAVLYEQAEQHILKREVEDAFIKIDSLALYAYNLPFQSMHYSIKASVFNAISMYDSSLFYYYKGVDVATAMKDTFSMIQMQTTLSFFLNSTGKDQKSKALAYRTLDLSKQYHELLLENIYEIIGKSYEQSNILDSASHYLLKALSIAKSKDDFKTLIRLYENLGYLYQKQNNYELSIYYFKSCIEQIKNKQPTNKALFYTSVYDGIGYSYYLQGNYQDSEIYLTKAYEYDNRFSIRKNILYHLYLLRKRQMKFKEAITIMDKYIVVRDSMNKISANDKIRDAELTAAYNSMNNKKKHLEIALYDAQNQTMKVTQQHYKRLIWVVLIGALFFMVSIIIYYRYQLNKAKLRTTIEELTASNIEKNQLNERVEVLEELDNKKEDIISKLLLKQEDSNTLKKSLSSIIADGLNTERKWAMFLSEFQIQYPVFYKKLLEAHPSITKSELRTVLLIKLGFNTVQISDLIGISVDGVRKSKQRIKKKFELNQKLDEYIINL